MFPLLSSSFNLTGMNRLLSEHSIRAVCVELQSAGSPVTGRQLRRALKERYGAVGKTERVFRIWREVIAARVVPKPAPVAEPAPEGWKEELDALAATAEQYRLRAERAEYREEAHQNKWAMEVDQLRQAVSSQPRWAAEIRSLQEQVLRLTVELHATRRVLANARGAEPSAAPDVPVID